MTHINLTTNRDAPFFASPSQGNKNIYVYEVLKNHRSVDIKKTRANDISYLCTLLTLP
jgi:hypothetical protein